MTEWLIQQLIQQQGPLCLVLITLMVMEHFFTARIGIRLMYKLWWMVPVVLLLCLELELRLPPSCGTVRRKNSFELELSL